ncbi:MAG: flagellar hook-associated protein FlgK [Thermoflavifilum sp.]|nr:flagellar hook-associated protein FlgK [Thermoflavifilum sp.]MCL6515295.1 flagellar hook-associated protein FlgK [Alicyclobacillus sp.]
MLGTFLGLETATRGLQAAQAAIETTSHNVANANTPGYSRQRVNLTTATALPVPGLPTGWPGQVGTGVLVGSITRLRDGFLDQAYWQQNQYLGNWTAQQSAISRVQAIVNEPSDTGLGTVLQNFWVAWDKLSSDPTDLSARTLVVQSAETLTSTLNETASQLNDLQSDLSASLSANVTQVNTLLNNIAQLNGEIQKINALGDTANDLMDQRDELVDQLSGLVAVTVTPQSDGTYDIAIGGVTVVHGAGAAQDASGQAVLPLQVTSGSTPPQVALADGTTLDTSKLGGQLQGTLTAMQTVAQYQADLDAFAQGLASGQMTLKSPSDWTDAQGNAHAAGADVTVQGLNGLLQMGYDGQGNPGVALFVAGDGSGSINASNMAVNPDVLNDVTKLAAGLSTNAGDGELASLVSSMRDATVQFSNSLTPQMPLTSGTYDEFLQALVGGLGVLGQQVNQQVTNQQALVQQADQARQSVSGVSIDEEMSNLIRYQQAYNASAKVIATLQDLFDTLMNNV